MAEGAAMVYTRAGRQKPWLFAFTFTEVIRICRPLHCVPVPARRMSQARREQQKVTTYTTVAIVPMLQTDVFSSANLQGINSAPIRVFFSVS